MFRKRAAYNGFVTDLGDLDPWQLTGKQAQVLDRLVSASPSLDSGRYEVQVLNHENRVTTYALTLRSPMVYRGAFDPSDINEKNLPILTRLLERADNSGICKSGLQCVKISPSRTIDVYDSRYTIVPRKKFSKTTYYDLIGSGIVGEGSFGSVRPIIGTIKPRFGDGDDLYFSPSENKRVMKFLYDHLYDKDRNPKIEKEVSLMRVAGYFKVRDDLIAEDGDRRVHIISMKRFPWVGLGRLINMDIEKKHSLSIADRLRLTIKLLRELQCKIHDRKIIHRDIKPDNIRVNKDKITKVWEVNFIDLGLSLSDGETSTRIAGTPYYLAPETANGEPQTKKSDVYALARTIGEIWRDKELKSLNSYTIELENFLRKRSDEKNIDFKLFDGLEMSDELKIKIEHVIRGLAKSDPTSRADTYMAVKEFEKIRLDMVIQQTAAEVVAYVRNAHAAAMLLTDKFEKYENGSHHVTSASFKMEILAHVKLLPEHPSAIRMFVETLAVKCLHDCVTRWQLIARVDSVFSGYLNAKCDYIHAVSSLNDTYRTNKINTEMAPLGEYILLCNNLRDHLLAKQNLGLDSLVGATKHIKSKMKEVNAAMTHYRDLAAKNDRPVILNANEEPRRYNLRK